jgi:uncharacterized protein (UPF0332 family)
MSSNSLPNASLQRLVERGLLKAEPPSRAEIGGFLKNAARLLADARNASNSVETRYLVAYNAGHLLALAALRAQGLRPAQGPGHRAVVFQVLPHTAEAEAELWVPLSKAHEKRNQIEYGGLADVSSAEAEQLVKSVAALDERVRASIARMSLPP